MPAFYKEWFYKTKRSLTAMVITKPQPKALTFTQTPNNQFAI